MSDDELRGLTCDCGKPLKANEPCPVCEVALYVDQDAIRIVRPVKLFVKHPGYNFRIRL